jgi:hypothetical protein
VADREEQVLDNPDTSYERDDVRLMVLGVLALVTIAFLVLIPLILRAAYSEALPDANRKLAVVLPAPVLQTDPEADLRAFRTKEEARLDSYGWVDRSKGIVHIPIRQAMDDIIAQGISGFPEGAP